MERRIFRFCVIFSALLMVCRASASGGAEIGGDSHTGGRRGRTQNRLQKLFVFGDSYADTGNIARMFSPAWQPPYGITFPKKPSGRFSDGRVLPDFIASFVGIRSPLPYKYRKFGKKLFLYGMNFAVGGTGVFDTGNFQRNLSLQIVNFSDQLKEGVFPAGDLPRSTALVTVNGNDYLYLKNKGGSLEDLKAYIPKVIEQLRSDLRKIRDLGVAKVAVTNLHPIGCTPLLAISSSYRECNDSVNLAVIYHNGLLAGAVAELNANESGGAAAEPFVLLDLYDAFKSVLTREMNKSEEALRPCCEAAADGFRCGSTDENGSPKYTVCAAPGSKFFWDSVHPTQAAWAAVVSFLGDSLRSLLP